VYPKKPEGRARRIDYRHVIHALVAKPQALRFSQLRDDLLPTSQYHQLWQRAAELLQQNPLPELKALQQRFIRHHATQPDISAKQHTIDAYDQLLNGSWITQEMPYV
jgi:hypothetical protein